MPARLLRRSVGPLCCAALLTASLTACGGTDTPKKTAGSAVPSTSGGASPSASASATADPKLSAIRARVQRAGTGSFTQGDDKVSGQSVSSAKGTYSLGDESLQATVTIPDVTSKKVATARLRVTGAKAFLQVDQWKKPSRSCWLASTPQELSQSYALDVSSGSTPLALALMDEFTVEGSSGPGTYQGQVSLQAAVPLLSGSLKEQIEQAQPKGTTPAYLVDDGKTITITVPGYGLIPELAAALGIDSSQFNSIKNDRYTATLTPGASAGTVAVPAAAKQMTDQQLAANTCG